MPKHPLIPMIVGVFAIAMASACTSPEPLITYSISTSQPPAPPPTNPVDRDPIGDEKYTVPTITEDTLFSDKVSDILNAFDTNEGEVKLQICLDTSVAMSGLTESELTQRMYSMSDISWSVLEDLVNDCNRIADSLR